MKFDIKKIITLGPSTANEESLRKMKQQGVDFVRVNMSHSSLSDLKYFISLSKKIGIPFIIDTEGSQVRTGDLNGNEVCFEENDEVKIYADPILGSREKICLKPGNIVLQLEAGDLLYVDFDTLILRVSDISTAKQGYIIAKVIVGGILGKNKGVAMDSASRRKYNIPPLSEKDYQCIEISLKEGIGYIAASFMRSGAFVDEVRRATRNSMKIISKIECTDSLENLDEIIQKSDYLLIDRGDLSKEIPLERIPFTQKIIIHRARKQGKEVIVATNLLETMVRNRKPTRAEIHDVISTIMDGATGLTLAAETAIGKYPIECINMLNQLIIHVQTTVDVNEFAAKEEKLIHKLESENYLLDFNNYSSLILPHGGKLVSRLLKDSPNKAYLDALPKIKLNENQLLDVEQIATGAFSPLEGFMGKKDLQNVLNKMRLANGIIWPLPIVLDVSEEEAEKLPIGKTVVLHGPDDRAVALFHLEEKYNFDKEEIIIKLYGTDSNDHPGVRMVRGMQPIFLGGKIDLLRRKRIQTKEFELTPNQVRRLLKERGWSRIVGFHTRNVIHRSHEFIQLKALEQECCDGLFVHPVIGKKKPGDFNFKYIIQGYEQMMESFYPKNKVIFSAFLTYSRYAGPREALFTAICRQNFGCSHFIVGRDHAGVGNFYHPYASHAIFDQFPDLEIKPIKFNKVFYSKKLQKYIHQENQNDDDKGDVLHISGTEARKMLEKGEAPPAWFMRPEISQKIIDAKKRGEEVFVRNNSEKGTIIWFTGLSGSGKTTIANELKRKLTFFGKKVEIIDGDVVRSSIHKRLGFSREDIRENNQLIAKLAKDKAAIFDFVLVPIISPYKEDRNMAKLIIGQNFFELFINASLEKCIERDTKGLYSKASRGEINNLIGVNKTNSYERPLKPDIEVNTDESSIDESADAVINFFEIKQSLLNI